MLYRDVEGKLNMQFVASIEQNHPIIPVLEKEFEIIPLNSHRLINEESIDLVVPALVKGNTANMIKSMNPSRLGDFFIIRMAAEEMGIVSDISKKALKVPSVLPGGLYLQEGKIFTSFRFHSADLGAISAIIEDIIRMKNRMTVRYLGPGGGGIAFLEEINRRIRLGVISYEYSTKVPEDSDISSDTLMEFNYVSADKDGRKAIVYCDPSNSRKISGTAIDSHEGIYTRKVNHPLDENILALSSERKISRAAFIQRYIGDGLRSCLVIPRSFMQEQLGAILDVVNKRDVKGFQFVAVSDYNSDIWNWI